MKSSFICMLCLSLVIGVASVAAARETPKRLFDVRFEAIDHNGDKSISEYEFTRKMTGQAKERAKEEFKSLDKNGDGTLHLREFGKH